MIPYTYVTSFMFLNENPAMNFTIFHNFFIGGLLPTFISIFRMISATKNFGNTIVWFPRITPIFTVINGIMSIKTKEVIAVANNEAVPKNLSMKASGGDLLFLIIQCFLWVFILILIELGVFSFLRKKGMEVFQQKEKLDEDVLREQFRIQNITEDKLAVKANHLRKVFDHNIAVKDLSFGIDFGDCFCLLGVNGAGKTTSFNMLTNFVVPTKGESHINGFNSKTEFREARKNIGY